MKRIFVFLLVALSFIFLWRYSSKIQGHNNLNTAVRQNHCIYGICFHNKPRLIDSILQMTNYNGLMLKVFDLKFEQQELIKSDSLIKRGYKKFPYMDWLEVPYRLKKYMNSNDSGYYLNDESHGERYLIIDYTSHKFILYDMGLLIDIYRPDSLNGKIK